MLLVLFVLEIPPNFSRDIVRGDHPDLLIEAARGETFWPSWTGWAIILFCALAPALGAQVFFLRAVDLIGAARAGYATVMFPVVALGISTVFEDYRWSLLSASGLGLVLAGNLIVITRSRG